MPITASAHASPVGQVATRRELKIVPNVLTLIVVMDIRKTLTTVISAFVTLTGKELVVDPVDSTTLTIPVAVSEGLPRTIALGATVQGALLGPGNFALNVRSAILPPSAMVTVDW